jgi:hypothetical protein
MIEMGNFLQILLALNISISFGQIEIDILNQLKTTVPIEDAQIRFSTS